LLAAAMKALQSFKPRFIGGAFRELNCTRRKN
jgi:hypothetical protein